MKQRQMAILIAGLWWGGLSGISFVVVPTLFAKLGAATAGPVAAHLFSIQAWMGLVLGMGLLLILRRQRGLALESLGGVTSTREGLASMGSTLKTMGLVVFALLLALLQEFAVAQNIVTARANGGNLRLWHTLGSGLVLGQWVCTGALLWRLSGSKDSH